VTETTEHAAAVDHTALRWVRRVAVAFVLIGVAFRCEGLGAKPVWHDETYSALAIAGSGMKQVRDEIFDGRVHAVGEFLAHQVPRQDTTVVDTVRMLARDDSKHTPLYFVTARLWVRVFGPSVVALRCYSAVLGLLALPLVLLLCRELFDRDLVGWIAICLFSVSPLHWLYGQEAREYMLWVDLILLSSWLLLRARRVGGGVEATRWAAGYAAAMTLALYTHLLTVMVAAGHLLFVAIDGRLRPTATVLRTTVALAVVGVLSAPWAMVLVAHAEQQMVETQWGTQWAANSVGLAVWSLQVGAAAARPFLDLDSSRLLWNDQILGVVPLMVAVACVVIVMRRAPRDARLFLLAVAASNALPYAAADLLIGGVRSSVIRYHFPAAIALQLCVAWAIAELLSSDSRRRRAAAFASAVLFAICGVVSRITYGRAETWWSKHYGGNVVAASKIINSSHEALVMTTDYDGTSFGKILSLAHQLDDDTQLLVTVHPNTPTVPEGYSEAFVWRIPGTVRESLAEQGWRLLPERVHRLQRLVRE
jgi:uncharacterized membrane protein